MANTELIQKYADEFVEKVFYFCLKKCGNPVQAEDLASEINCNVLYALSRDTATQNFPAWVWAVARQTPGNSPVSLLDELVGYGYLQKENGQYHPTFLVQFGDKLGELTGEQKTEYQKLTAPAIDLLDSLYRICREAVMQEVPEFLREDAHQINHAIANIMFPRESVFKEALGCGWLRYDATDSESAKRRMLGAYLVIG